MKEDLPQSKKTLKYLKLVVIDTILYRLLCFLILGYTFTVACSQKKVIKDQLFYDGPLSRLDNINTLLSDSAQLVMNMVASVQNNFEGGNKEWPEGLEMKTFGDSGNVVSFFRADYVYFTDSTKTYHAQGAVMVKNYQTEDELHTEELFWNLQNQKIFTKKFVTIRTDDELHTGNGMTANQDFTTYRIVNPQGSFTLRKDTSQLKQENDSQIEQ